MKEEQKVAEQARTQQAAAILRRAVARAKLTQEEVRTQLSVHLSTVSRLLDASLNFTTEIRQRVLQRADALGLEPDDLVQLIDLWPAEARAQEQQLWLETPSMLLALPLLIAERRGLFRCPEEPFTRVSVRWRDSSGVRLSGDAIANRVLYGPAHFGLMAQGLWDARHLSPDRFRRIIRVGRAARPRICVREERYEATLKSQPPEQRLGVPTFHRLIEEIEKAKGAMAFDPQSSAGGFIEWLAREMRLPALEKLRQRTVSESIFVSHDDLVRGLWRTRHDASSLDVIVTWTPLSYLLTRDAEPKYRYVEISESYYDEHDRPAHPYGFPLLNRTLPHDQDVYRKCDEFPLDCVLFTKPETAHEHPSLGLTIYQALCEAARLIRRASESDDDRRKLLSEVACEFWEMIGRVEPPTVEFFKYLDSEIRSCDPIFEYHETALTIMLRELRGLRTQLRLFESGRMGRRSRGAGKGTSQSESSETDDSAPSTGCADIDVHAEF